MSARFWEYFAFRSLTLYYQLSNHYQHHGFMIVLNILGDELGVKPQECVKEYILSFQECTVDPILPIDIFTRHMKVCRSVYAREHPAQFRIDSYLCNVLCEISNCHLEKDCYKPRV